MNDSALFPMRVVSERTGLSPHVIRVWERRYQAVVPHRTETNRRLYTRADVDRLLLLRRAVDRGHAISRIAELSNEELRDILKEGSTRESSEGVSRAGAEASYSADEYLELALEASKTMNANRLEDLLGSAEIELGRYVLVNTVISGLLQAVGELWQKGEMRPHQEHLTSAVVRKVLDNAASAALVPGTAPAIVLATPSGHNHELGCLMAAAIAVMQGWRIVYLGSSLPAEEILGATIQTHARAVGLRKLRKGLPQEVTLLLGGRAANSYREIETERVRFVGSIEEMHQELERLATSFHA
jgi:DNA-binding transcriptional MerR regulator